jgi:hypothetical protein
MTELSTHCMYNPTTFPAPTSYCNHKNNNSNNNNSSSSRKGQNSTDVPIADYSKIRDPLPQPPSGLSWKRNDDTREWTLVNDHDLDDHNDLGLTDENNNKNDRNNTNENPVSYAGESVLVPAPIPMKHRTDSCCSNTSSITEGSTSNNYGFIHTTPMTTSKTTTMTTAVEDSLPINYYNNEYILPPHPKTNTSINNDNTNTNCGSSRRSSHSTLGSSDDVFSYTTMTTSDCYSINNNNSSNSSLKGNEYTKVEHIILPKDTLQGLCIQYKVSATRLRQVNQFSGSSLVLAPKRLLIPIKNRYIFGSSHDGASSSHCSNNSGSSHGSSGGIKFQNTTTQEYKIHKVLSECNDLGMKEIQAYLELYDWDVNDTIDAAKADNEWEKSSIEECKSPIDPPSTSYYQIDNADYNINLRLTQKREIFRDNHNSKRSNATTAAAAVNLLELKAIKDASERWEELSHTNSYKSCIDNSEKLPVDVVGLSMNIQNQGKSMTVCAEDYYKAPPIDYGIEMKEMKSLVS